tara:strand:+ start:2709 stop:3218 length:510 start_codon:yes stop_codon:yes gene_type:complete
MAARKNTKRKVVKKKTKASSSAKAGLKWEFPTRELHILRIEMFALLVFAVFIFWYMYHQFEQQFFGGALSAILFVSLYFVISSIVKRIHSVEEKYNLSNKELRITRFKNGKKIATETVALADIVLHKFDHFFLGAYILTKARKHVLFFNNEKESRKVHGHLQRKAGKRR